MKKMSKFWKYFLAICVAIFIFISCWTVNSHIEKEEWQKRMLREEVVGLEKKVAGLENMIEELESTIKRVTSTRNKVEQIKPQLIAWVYKSSRISQKMAAEIVDSVAETSYPFFLLALIKTESNFNPTAVSVKGAMGLGQIMPIHEETLKGAGILKEMRDIFNISIAVEATEFIWDCKMSEAKGSVDKALALYLGVKNESYSSRILKDYFYLNYLSKKPLINSVAKLVPVDRAELPSLQRLPATSLKGDKKGEIIYRVQQNDTVGKIAKKVYGLVTIDILRIIKKANPEIKNLDHINIGQEIIFPSITIKGSVKIPAMDKKTEGGP